MGVTEREERARAARLCAALAGLFGGAGCVAGDLVDSLSTSTERVAPSSVVPEDRLLTIRQLEVQGVVDERQVLEVEVHLFDARSMEHLGCAGEFQGLSSVDVASIAYSGLNANLAKPGSAPGYPAARGARLSCDDVRGRTLRVLVSEDDTGACPQPFGEDDDEIGELTGVLAEQLAAGARLQFGQVTTLSFGALEACADADAGGEAPSGGDGEAAAKGEGGP
jgi:hypothetical protein